MKLTCGWLTHGMKSSALRTLCRAIINSTCGSRTAVGVLSLACPRESTQREGPPGGRKRFLRSSGLGRRQFTAPPCTVNWERTPCPLPFGLLPKPCGARSAPYGDPEQPLPRQQNLSWVFCCSCSCCCRSIPVEQAEHRSRHRGISRDGVRARAACFSPPASSARARCWREAQGTARVLCGRRSDRGVFLLVAFLLP